MLAVATTIGQHMARETGVVTKSTVPVGTADRVEAVLQLGHRVFGENYVQEAQGKWPDLRARFPGLGLAAEIAC